nr:MAG TPA: hypothetical protein [Caudoviricetes sp.]
MAREPSRCGSAPPLPHVDTHSVQKIALANERRI